MPTYSLFAIQTPLPIAPATPVLGTGTMGPVATGMTAGSASGINQMAAALLAIGQAGAGGYAILTGGALSISAGLNIAVAPGVFLLDGVIELTNSGSPVGTTDFYQVSTPSPYTLANNATNYVWLTASGALAANTTLGTPPAGARLFLGTVTTSAGAITNIDASGVLTLSGGLFRRQTADVGPPTDTPPNILLLTQTVSGWYLWNGSSHVNQVVPPNVQTLSGTLTLGPASSRTQLLTASAANRAVKLPLLTNLPSGAVYTLWNQGSANNILVQDSTGAALITLTPGQAVSIPVCTAAGTNAWPASGITAVTPSTGGVVGPGS